jgi:hypothetical protein
MSMIDTSLFPYENFGVRLEIKAENRIAWFKDDYDLQKYLVRSKLDKRTLKIDYRDEPVISSKKHKRSVEQKPKPKSNGGTSSVRKRKSSVDTSRNTPRTTKRKKSS